MQRDTTRFPIVLWSTYNDLIDDYNRLEVQFDNQQTRMNDVIIDNNRQLQEIAALKQEIEDLKKLSKDQSRRIIELQEHESRRITMIQDTNSRLLAAGKSLANFVKAWKFRKENPNMNPKTRQNNNADLDLHLDALVSEMPKQVEQDPDPAKKD